MWVPDWLYERLPLVYICASGACVGLLQTSFASASAFLLFAAAALTYSQRRSARREAPIAYRTRHSAKQ